MRASFSSGRRQLAVWNDTFPLLENKIKPHGLQECVCGEFTYFVHLNINVVFPPPFLKKTALFPLGGGKQTKILSSAVEGASETSWIAGGMAIRRGDKVVIGAPRNKVTLGKYKITLFVSEVCVWKWAWERFHLVCYYEVVERGLFEI